MHQFTRFEKHRQPIRPFKMLWKKESNKSSALYIDFIRNASDADFNFDQNAHPDFSQLPFPFNQMVYQPPSTKSDPVSVQNRMYGNKSFGTGNWITAIEWYNESLCLAPKASKNIALAYANRASCFLKLKMYDACLADIELAKQAGYPTEIMLKLNQRKANCLKEMESCQNESKPRADRLSYEPNENFPSMANVLRPQKGNAGKYAVIATQDIDVGQTVLVENVLFGCQFPKYAVKCSLCLKSNTNLIACTNCTKAMFCSTECQSSRVHALECGIQFSLNMFGTQIMAMVRSVLVAISLFPSADALMHFVEETRKSNVPSLPTTMTDDKSRYHAYIKQKLCADDFDRDEMAASIAPIYKKLMSVPAIKQMFRAKKHERFLQHLIGNHSLIAGESGRGHDGRQTHLTMKYFAYSCSPNLISVVSDGRLIFITARPIQKGEELFDSIECRNRDCCGNKHYLACECKLCKGLVSRPTAEQRRQLAGDPNFKHIMAMGDPSTWKKYDEAKLQATSDKCVNFLKEFGQVEWCDEIAKVMGRYRELIHVGMDKSAR